MVLLRKASVLGKGGYAKTERLNLILINFKDNRLHEGFKARHVKCCWRVQYTKAIYRQYCLWNLAIFSVSYLILFCVLCY